MYEPHFFIRSSISGHLGCLHVLVIVNSAAMNIGVHVSFQIRVLFRYIPRSGTGGSYSNSIFSFLKKLHSFLHSDCTNSHSHQQCMRAFLHTLSSIFIVCGLFNDGHSDHCKVIPHCSFDCISLIISDVGIFSCA